MMHRFRPCWLIIIVITCAWLPACSAGSSTPSTVRIAGKVLGDGVVGRIAGAPTLVPIPATIQCNGVSATTTQAGTFSLTLAPAVAYQCAVTATGYLAAALTLAGESVRTRAIAIDFTQASASRTTWICPSTPGATALQCPALSLQNGMIAGTITDGTSHAPLGDSLIRCTTKGSDPTDPVLNGTTDAAGHYELSAVYPGTYFCTANETKDGYDWYQAQTVEVRPAVVASGSMQICHACARLGYHGGPVMHSYTVYLLFWQPPGFTYEPQPNGSDARYQAKMAQFFRDEQGTPFAALLGQYWDRQGFASGNITVGGTYTDASPFRYCGNDGTCKPGAHDPLASLDVLGEIQQGIQHEHWQPSPDTEFMLFLPFITDHCVRAVTGCGNFFHSSIDDAQGVPLIYGVISSAAHDQPCLVHSPTPSGDCAADAVIATLSHEQYESITDPEPGFPAWLYDADLPNTFTEIGDICSGLYGPVGADGANITLNGHPYLVQQMWSNHANGCALQ